MSHEGHEDQATKNTKITKPREVRSKWLRKGIEERADCMAWLGVEPWMEPFRSAPRYEQLVREIGLAPISPQKSTP